MVIGQCIQIGGAEGILKTSSRDWSQLPALIILRTGTLLRPIYQPSGLVGSCLGQKRPQGAIFA